MLETAVSPTMPRHIGRVVAADRHCRWAPQVTRLLIPQIKRLAWAIADRVVGPRRKLVFAAVDRPGVAAALRGHLEAESGVGDDIDPGCRRCLAWTDCRYIFPSVFCKAAKPVEELQSLTQVRGRETRGRRFWYWACCRRGAFGSWR